MDTKALRQKILDLAIRGKLVPQDPNDEPASVLLERIRAEKRQMVKDGKLKPKDIKNDTVIFKGDDNLHYEKFSDGMVKCIEDEIPFDVPDGWCWTRIQNIAQFQGGFAYKSSKYIEKSNNIIIRIGNVKNNELNPQIATKYISNEYASETSSYKIRSDDILFTMTGTRGKRDYFYSCLVSLKELKDTRLYLNQRVGCLRIFDIDYIFPKFFLIALQSCFVLDAIFRTETGNVSQGNIGSTATLNLLVPILPVNEQKRIIGKINLFFALVKNIEKNKLSLIDDVSSAITKILDLAIRGKLVPQDPNDKPASVLLERIRAEKEELIKQGKIKRDKKESVIFKGDDNSYYQDLPSNWIKIRLSSISEIITKGTTPRGGKVAYSQSGIGFLRAENIAGYDKLDLSNLNYVDEESHNNSLKRSILKENDILITIAGTLGRTAIVPQQALPLNTNQAVAIVRLVNNRLINVKYLVYALNSPIIKSDLLTKSVDMAIPNLSLENIADCNIPLPPLAEQKRIVEAIEKIFATLDYIANQVV